MKRRRTERAPQRWFQSGGAAGGIFLAGLVLGTPGAGHGEPAAGDVPIVVALDPGHGGTNLGASGPQRGVYEKAVTLALAERIRDLLEDRSGRPTKEDEADQAHAPRGARFAVVLCRLTDQLVPIRARARCAEESGARLFVSLHTNAVPAGVSPGTQHGFEVFVLGPREIEDDAALAALGAGDDSEAVWRAHQARTAGERSIGLARALADELTRALGADARRGIKQSGAALDVLRGTRTPAALVEVGFLDHPEEGARLATPAGREPIAQALAAAIRSYSTHNDDAQTP